MKSKLKSKSKTLEIQAHEASRSQFAFAMARIAVAQICQSVGFKGCQRSALETLTDVAARYLQALAKSAASSATSSGRTQSNLLDVVGALEDLHSVHGFPGASTLNTALLSSSTLTDIIKFVNYTDEIPFAKPIRCDNNPSKESVMSHNSVNGKGLEAVKSHIPRWLPAVPEMSGTENGGKGNGRAERVWFGSLGNVDGCLVGEKMEVVERESCIKMKKMELPATRGRVRFKMGVGMNLKDEGFGVDLRNGVCRGGKRVLCGNWSHEDDKRPR